VPSHAFGRDAAFVGGCRSEYEDLGGCLPQQPFDVAGVQACLWVGGCREDDAVEGLVGEKALEASR
jgi:hypothetical protein